ncbi:MAG: hypothetical protein IPH18_12265 [Chitinophagaceae bacterium]|nr:hypothetical protein [Chitinophagaceae bacterium]
MQQRNTFFLVVLLLMFQGITFGQSQPSFKAKSGVPNFDTVYYKGYWSGSKWLRLSKPNLQSCADSLAPKEPALFLLKTLPQYYYTNQSGFFCQKELQLDKITTVPIRFRLGSVEYVNWMEQKPNAIKPRL